MAQDWFQRWHNVPWPTGGTGSGGSTSMSTGVANALANKTEVGHVHQTVDVSGLTTALAALNSSVGGMTLTLATKAQSTHVHISSDVTGLDSTLAGLASQISTKAAGTHTHTTADVTGLDTALSSKAGLQTGLVVAAQLGSGTPTASVFLRGDRTWAAPTAAASGVIPSTWAVASTHVLTGSTTMQSVTGLSFAVSSAAVYRFEFTVGWQTTSTTTGLALGVNGPASPTLLAYAMDISTGLGIAQGRTGRAFGVQSLPVPGSSAANVDMYGYVGGVVRTGANAGTLQLQCASEVAGSTVSVRAGSVGFLFGPL